MATVTRLDRLSPEAIDQLADVLIDCVDGGASVSFMAPLARDKALAFWQQIAVDVEARRRALLVALDAQRRIVGTSQLLLDMPENQPHRADVVKMLVHRGARQQGVAEALMRALEDAARDEGKTLLVLDTASAAAERLYERLGWSRVGVIPDFALMPDGAPCSTTVYFKRIDID